MICRYAQRSEEAYRVGDDNKLTPIANGPMLCAWGMDAAPDQLINVPRWLQRNALAGHLMKYPEDCNGCPCFESLSGATSATGDCA